METITMLSELILLAYVSLKVLICVGIVRIIWSPCPICPFILLPHEYVCPVLSKNNEW